jgi:hypothetical protein
VRNGACATLRRAVLLRAPGYAAAHDRKRRIMKCYPIVRVAAVPLALALFAGCSAGSEVAGYQAEHSNVPIGLQAIARPALHPLARGAGWLSPAAKKCKEKLYVSSYRLGYVAIYCTKGRNQAPIGEITDGINTPEGADVDSKGNLYITNTDADTVTEYAPGSVDPSFTYSAGLGYPAGVAVDAKQNVYVASLSPASVEVFAQKTNSPSLTITNLTEPIDVSLDPSGDAYVTT